MNNNNLFSYLLILLLSLSFSCSSRDRGITSLYQEWSQKRIKLPGNIVFTKYIRDSIDYNINTNCKILLYVDSSGCTMCKLKLYEWSSFMSEIKNIAGDQVSFVFTIYPNNKKNTLRELRSSLIAGRFDYPITIDLYDSLNHLNHFPNDDRFRCFLLDSLNNVILIGNPIQKPKIKDLYIKAIAQRIGKKYDPQVNNLSAVKNEISLGVISKSDVKTALFTITNTESSDIIIDSIFSSCQCTKAEIDQKVIQPTKTALLSVTYHPDNIGDFYREVYVKIKGSENLLTYIIRGKVEE